MGSQYKAVTIVATTTDDASAKQTVVLDGTNAVIRAGGFGQNGTIELMPSMIASGSTPIPGGSNPAIGDGAIGEAQSTIYLDGQNAHVRIGGGIGAPGQKVPQPSGQAGLLTLADAYGTGYLGLRAASSGKIAVGGEIDTAPVQITGKGTVTAGGGTMPGTTRGARGLVEVLGDDGKQRATLDGTGTVSAMDGDGHPTISLLGDEGIVRLYHSFVPPSGPDKGKTVWHPTIGLHADGGQIHLAGNDGDTKIHLNGDSGNANFKGTVHADEDVTVGGSDCAEEFDVSEADAIEPGTVMVIDGQGSLRRSAEAYDSKVAGVVSGAGEYRPGIVLGKHQKGLNRTPIALAGKVFCKVDAQHSAIEVGDLLTTSATPGHAMRAADPSRAFGAVIGKALRPLSSGQGLIPVLVSLQ